MTYQQCKRCLMDNKSDKTIKFDKSGYCNYCTGIIKRKPLEYFPDAEGKKLLDSMMSEIRINCKDDEYDCLVGVSGGIDSSYILYKGYQYGLRMLAVHIDDGLDNPIAVENLDKLVEATGTKLINISPDRKEYSDILYSLFKASVPNLAIVQDNLIAKSLQDYAEKEKIKYMLDGHNFAHESILERGEAINACDAKYILSIQRKFGKIKIEKLEFLSLIDRYIRRHSRRKVKHIRPLNYMEYNLANAIKELKDFCGFQYYGGKHYESILTRFMQCYYLPEKFGIDKRKSHYSSLIMSGQMTREEGLEKLKKPLYPNLKMLEEDKKFLAEYIGVSVSELDRCIALEPKRERDYPHSVLNEMAPLARKFRRLLE